MQNVEKVRQQHPQMNRRGNVDEEMDQGAGVVNNNIEWNLEVPQSGFKLWHLQVLMVSA